jgi:hypothetical protein
VSQNLNSQSFSECLHTSFHIDIGSGAEPLGVKLIDVEEKNYTPQTDQFSLIFHGPLTPVLPQKIYRLDHDRLGEMDLFLVPIGPKDGGMQYQAVFNRFRPDQSR